MKYYIVKDGQRVGPMELSELANFSITADTLVWHEGMTDWAAAGTVPELAQLVTPGVPPQAPNAPQAPYAPQQPNARQQAYASLPPKTYLTEAILVTVLCCMPLGIVSIIKATQVSSATARGDYASAQQASAEAGKWVKWGFICGLAYLVVSMIYVIAMIAIGGGL